MCKYKVTPPGMQVRQKEKERDTHIICAPDSTTHKLWQQLLCEISPERSRPEEKLAEQMSDNNNNNI